MRVCRVLGGAHRRRTEPVCVSVALKTRSRPGAPPVHRAEHARGLQFRERAAIGEAALQRAQSTRRLLLGLGRLFDSFDATAF